MLTVQLAMNKKSEKGQALIEAIIAITVVTAVITAVVAVIITSLSSTNAIKNNDLATNYAQQGIELVRDIKSAGFADFVSNYPTEQYCLDDYESSPELLDDDVDIDPLDPDSDPDCDLETGYNVGNYIRRIYINHLGNDSTGVNVCAEGTFVSSKVLWNDNKCVGDANCHNVEIKTCFTDLNELQPL